MNNATDTNGADGAPPQGPLHHIRVLDLSRILAGPWSGQLLGDLGADVIKVEQPGHGDDTRVWGPPFLTNADGSRGDASYYTAANRNKRSIIIDFATNKGAEMVRELAKKADVLIENFKVGGLKKYCLDYAAVSALNPSIVYCSITGFGQTGPDAARPGYDYVIQGMGGVMSINGVPDGEPGAGPLRAGIAVSDLFGGMYAASAILGALVHKERTGEGQHIDCALLATQIAALANQGASHLTGGVVPVRTGNSHPAVVPYRVYEASDGHLILAVGNDAQFRRCCDALGLEEAKADPRFATTTSRIENRAAIDAALEEAFAKWKRADALAALEKAVVPCGPINSLDEVYENPQIKHRELLDHPKREDGTEVAVAGYPVHLSKTPASTRRAPPAYGGDTAEILRRELGLSGAEIAELKSASIIA